MKKIKLALRLVVQSQGLGQTCSFHSSYCLEVKKLFISLMFIADEYPVHTRFEQYSQNFIFAIFLINFQKLEETEPIEHQPDSVQMLFMSGLELFRSVANV